MNIFRKPIIWLMLFCLIFAGFPTPGLSISVKEEEELADEFLRVLRRHFKLVEDPVVVDYVNSVGKRILENMPPQPFTYHFYVVEQDVFNAFATPAGHIFVFSGLLEAMEQEEELAGILAHEIAHVQCRHISDKIERSKKVNILTMAGTIAGILLGVGGMGDVGQAVAVGSAAASQSTMLAYSRQDETQADQFGIENLFNAGYNGDGLVSVLEKIRSRTWFGPDDIPTYLMTHPAVEERIVSLRSQVDAFQQKNGRRPDVDVTPFVRAQSRLISNPAAAENQLRRYETKLKQHPGDSMGHYRYGLLLAKVGRRDEAIDHFRTALSRRAFDPVILSDLGRVYFQEGKYENALSTLGNVVQMAPNEVEGRFYLGRTKLKTGDFSSAAEHFEKVVQDQAGYTDALFYLGKCYDRLGRKADALYYLGKFYYQKGEMKKAVFQLKKALESDPESPRQADIETLMEDIRKTKQKKVEEERNTENDGLRRQRRGIRPASLR